ncbi:MAG TPA: AI-2E family transporter [Pyrinomonadaceae bacterium]
MSSRREAKEVAEAAALAALPAWTQTRVVLRVMLIVLALGATLWIVYKLTAVILLIVLSIFFAYLVAPLVEFVHRPIRIGGRERLMPRGIAIGIVYLFLFFSVGLVIYLLVPRLGSQFPEFAEQAKAYSKTVGGSIEHLNEYLRQHNVPQNFVDAINSNVPRIAEKVGEFVSVVATSVVGWMLAFIPWLVLIPIFSFFLLKDAESFRRSALQMLPRGRWRWRGDEFFQDINSTLAAYVRAQLTASVLVGLICGIGFAVLGLPNALVLGVLAGVFEFVPLVGPLLIALIAVTLAMLHSGLGTALVVMLFLGVLRILQDYVIYPRLIGQGIHLHPMAVILSILCGAELAGVAGIFLAIPVIALLTVAYRHWLEHRGSEGLVADLLQPAEQLLTEPTSGAAKPLPTTPDLSPTTTPEEMARARPDLTTGELRMPVED